MGKRDGDNVAPADNLVCPSVEGEGKYRDTFRDMEQHKYPVSMSFLLASPAESSDVDIMDADITKDRILGHSSHLELEPEIHFSIEK